jgi:predicted acyl esterase
MKVNDRVRGLTLLAFLLGTLLFVEPSAAQTAPPSPASYPALPSETPANFEPATNTFDYIKRDVMIPMRDRVKLHTIVLVPKSANAHRSS